MLKPTKFSVNEQICQRNFSGQEQDQITSAAYDGRSFKMRGFEQVCKSLGVAGLMLLLLLVAGMGSSLFAQIVATPNNWPAPAAVPSTPAVLPIYQTVPAAFDMTGMMQYASLDATPGICQPNANPSAANPPLPAQCKTTGGYLELGDVVIKIPSSTVIVFPNTLMTWEEMFEFNPSGVASESGLAMSDTKRMPGNYIVHVQGNIVNGNYIAGLVFINQVIADAGIQGFIEKFDYANGTMYVDGTRVQLNDPKLSITVPNPDGTPLLDGTGNPIVLNKGRYSAGQSPDVRFAVDQDNPSVTAQSGYP